MASACPSGQVSARIADEADRDGDLVMQLCGGGGGNDELCQTCCAYSYNATETRRGPVRRCVAWASSSASACASEVPILEQAFEVFTCSPDGSTTSCQRACDRFEAQAVSHGVRTRHASPAALLLIAVVWAKTT